MQDKSLKLKNKVILITNAGSDAGMHIALYCATQGASLALNFSKNTCHNRKGFIYQF